MSGSMHAGSGAGKARFYALATGLAFAGLFALSAMLGAFYTVDEGERAVILTNGRVTDVTDPGLHFKVPFFQAVKTVDVRTNNWTYDNVAAYSKDQQTADLKLSVNVRIDPGSVRDVYSTYGSLESLLNRFLHPRVYQSAKDVFGQFSAQEAVQQRARLNAEITNAIIKAAAAGDVKGLVIEGVQLENIDFDDVYENAQRAAAKANADIATATNELARERQNVEKGVVAAEAQAKATKAAADAKAYAIRAEGEAQAFAMAARGKALRENPDLIDYAKVEKWNGVTPIQMVPGNAVPIVGLKQ